MSRSRIESLIGSTIIAAGGFALYGICRLIGWLIDLLKNL
jgi:hypothetical protein